MRDLEMNPYVIQIDKFVHSLDKLSKVFLHTEKEELSVTEESLRDMKEEVRDRVCKNCERKRVCAECDKLPELIHTIESYGAELNVETKRKIQKKCNHAPQFLKAVLDVYKNEKQALAWKKKMVENRADCVGQLDSFAHMIQHSTRELDASIFEDEPLERKIKNRFQKAGIKLLSTVFMVTENGRYEIHVTVKAGKGECVATKEIVKIISECAGRKMVTASDERTVVGTEYATIVCLEGPKYHTLQGIARIGKGCDKISGDNFSMVELPGGKHAVILSDGMGAGQIAFRESAMVVEVLEELLQAGFPKDTALQMLNTAMVMGREDVRFCTIDMGIFDLYTGNCEFVKAGASTTFVKSKDCVEAVRSSSLPLGVVSKLEPDYLQRELENGDTVIMITDGVLDALPVGEQDFLMQMLVEGTVSNNPKEIAHHILEQVLSCSGEIPLDDMTVLVVSIWSLEK